MTLFISCSPRTTDISCSPRTTDISCSPRTTETSASLAPDCLYIGRRFPLISSLLPLSVFLNSVFASGVHQNSRKSFPGMLMFCLLFLFPVKGSCNRANIREQDNNSDQYCKANEMHFLYSVHYELTASTCFEHYLLIFRRRCTNNNRYMYCLLKLVELFKCTYVHCH
jgi:hypothetical protein